MEESDKKWIKIAFVLAIGIAAATSFFWDSSDPKGELEPALGRTEDEVKKNPVGKDQELKVTPPK